MNFLIVAALGSLVAFCACESSSSTIGIREQKAALTVTKRTGDPCVIADGWMPAAMPNSALVGNTDTPLIKIPPGTLFRENLPPGVGYCLPVNEIYPDGYFTMSCAGDSDCGIGSRCDEIQCRKVCSSDADCRAGMFCIGGSDTTFRYCTAQLKAESE